MLLASLFADVSIDQLLTRMTATAFVVIGVTIAVGRLGPVIGGALAGLPIVLGPGFFFLARQASPDFVSDAAAYSLLSLCATQLFLLAYIMTARRAGPLMSLVAALTAWGAAATVFRLIPPNPILGVAMFTALTVAARLFAARFVGVPAKAERADNLGLLCVRAVLAGILVAVVTGAASQFGAITSGLLLAFPIGYTVLAITIHEQFGKATVALTLHSAILGTTSLAGFCAALAFAAPFASPASAFLFALAVSVAITIGLMWRLRRTGSSAGSP